jgi:hypothetical protein
MDIGIHPSFQDFVAVANWILSSFASFANPLRSLRSKKYLGIEKLWNPK